ncbi:hypothetical protein DENIT_30069 [Pseudomonas veronii]|nr:hypothetical protein DENIT_30069 [Pseudomonas veronii]
MTPCRHAAILPGIGLDKTTDEAFGLTLATSGLALNLNGLTLSKKNQSHFPEAKISRRDGY